ncbi:endonuclease VII [Mycobacterium phage Mabel]|nr:endonuclease VII [Mycobacterium phage Mabel]
MAGRDPEVERMRHVAKMYGLTLEEAKKYWYAERCHLCGSTDPRDRRGKFQIDHCHKTGKVRGALCMPCNVGIGYLQDDPALMRRAADYVERHRSG